MRELTVALLTGGIDPTYAFGLATALAGRGIKVEVVGGREVEAPEFHTTPGIRFVNLYPPRTDSSTRAAKIWRLITIYARLIKYAALARPGTLHILWNNRLAYFDRTLLTIYFRAMGSRVFLTAHNVNMAKRDKHDSWLNRWTLRVQYQLADRIFVHTKAMAAELRRDFRIPEEVPVQIPFGINNAMPQTGISPAEAKRRLGFLPSERVLLVFGRIQPYKGLEYLIEAFSLLPNPEQTRYRLVIAGEPMKDFASYWTAIERSIADSPRHADILTFPKFIPAADTELYFQASDVCVLPYTDIYQSGVLSLSYSFGLPAVATDVGSFSEDIVSGETGLVCKPRDGRDLALAITKYFESSLYRNLAHNRALIRSRAMRHYSWDVVAEVTQRSYWRRR
jgi:glycosyltransferase involved in cell wall biosynthesis